MTPRRLGQARRPLAALVAAGIVAMLASHGVAAQAASSSPASVTLQGEGSDDPKAIMTSWQNDLYGKAGTVNLNYLANGGYGGRQDFIAGNLDYVISGVPFTPDELKNYPHGSNDLIDAPVHVAAMGVLALPPKDFLGVFPSGFGLTRLLCDPNNPPDPLPPGAPPDCILRTGYSGPINLPKHNLAAMLIGVGHNSWSDPAVVNAFGLSLTPGKNDFPDPNFPQFSPEQSNPQGHPVPILRSEPSETNYYAQRIVTTVAPDVWAAAQQFSKLPFGPITERLQPQGITTRPGADSQMALMESDGAFNLLAAVPTYAFAKVQALAPKNRPEWVHVENASGQYVEPTPASIDAAVNAGGDSPMFALTNQVAGSTPAYPLVWVDHLYAPAHGLSAAKTEALAATIRYMATVGQGASASVGDGQLSQNLASQALAAANQLVVSNCTGANVSVVVNSDPGPYAPVQPPPQTIGPMAHCQQNAPTPTTTTTATTTPITTTLPTSTFGSGVSPSSTGSSPSAGASSTAGGAVASAPSAQAGGSSRPSGPSGPAPPKGALAVARLPLPLPWDGGGGFDRLTGLLVGAALYLSVRRPIGRLLAVLSG